MIGQTGTKPDADGDFSNAPNFNFNDDKVKFDTKYVDNTNDNYGSASWFPPKSLPFERRHSFGAFQLLLGTHPSSKHPADLIYRCLQEYVSFDIK